MDSWHNLKMKPLLLSFLVALTWPIAAIAETTYLVIKSKAGAGIYTNTSLVSIPMDSKEQCEEAGVELMASKRFRLDVKDGFECIVGK